MSKWEQRKEKDREKERSRRERLGGGTQGGGGRDMILRGLSHDEYNRCLTLTLTQTLTGGPSHDEYDRWVRLRASGASVEELNKVMRPRGGPAQHQQGDGADSKTQGDKDRVEVARQVSSRNSSRASSAPSKRRRGVQGTSNAGTNYPKDVFWSAKRLDLESHGGENSLPPTS